MTCRVGTTVKLTPICAASNHSGHKYRHHSARHINSDW